MKKYLPKKKNEKGQSMVELALTITILMVLLAGTIDLGRAFFTWLAMRDAAQEAAAYGSIVPTDESGMIARAKDNLGEVVRDPTTSIRVVPSFSPAWQKCFGGTLTIDVWYDQFPIAMPFLSMIIGRDWFPIHATINDTIIHPLCP